MDSQQPSHPRFRNRQGSSHVVNLPYDILVMIFTLCWKEQEEKKQSDEEEEGGGSHFPTTASHVCRTWRQHALVTPVFWTVLEFRQRKPPVEKYETWLERSRDCSLDIIIGPQPFKASSINHAKAILRLTGPHFERWRSISAYELPNKVLRVIFDRVGIDGAGRLGKLETVKVVQGPKAPRYREPTGRTRRGFKPFSNTGEAPPALRNLILEGTDAQYFSGRFRLFQVWRIINRLVDPNRGVHNFHDFLSALPDLRVLHAIDFRFFRYPVELDHTQSTPASSVPILTHHGLTELSLYTRLDTRNTIISSLILPNLRYPLDQERAEPAIGVRCLSHLARNHPFPQLVSLRLVGSRSEHSLEANATTLAHLEGALAGLPRLKTLTFNSMDFGRLGGYGSHLSCLDRVCPRLRWLILVECLGYTLEGLVSIVEQRGRCEGMASLVRILVQDWALPPGTANELESLKRLVVFELVGLKGGTHGFPHYFIHREWMRSMGV